MILYVDATDSRGPVQRVWLFKRSNPIFDRLVGGRRFNKIILNDCTQVIYNGILLCTEDDSFREGISWNIKNDAPGDHPNSFSCTPSCSVCMEKED